MLHTVIQWRWNVWENKNTNIIVGLTHSDSLLLFGVSVELKGQPDFVAVGFLLPDSQKSCHRYSQSVVSASALSSQRITRCLRAILLHASAFHRFTCISFPSRLAFLCSLSFSFIIHSFSRKTFPLDFSLHHNASPRRRATNSSFAKVWLKKCDRSNTHEIQTRSYLMWPFVFSTTRRTTLYSLHYKLHSELLFINLMSAQHFFIL